MTLPTTRIVDLNDLDNQLSSKKGIYFWYDKKDNSLVYIGIAKGRGGLRTRISKQHLRPDYLETRPSKHTSKDGYQLKHAIVKETSDPDNKKKAIDKSSFRKSIGRTLSLKPGHETVNYIKSNLRLEVHENEDEKFLVSQEKYLISKYQPRFNTASKAIKNGERTL